VRVNAASDSLDVLYEASGLRILCAEGGAFSQNTLVALCTETGQCVVIDPGGGIPDVMHWLTVQKLNPEAIWLTHAHLDHVEGIPLLRARWPDLPVWLHALDRGFYEAAPQQAQAFGLPFEGGPLPSPTHAFDGVEVVQVGNQRFQVRHAPGHAPGHVILVHAEKGVALVGDVIFAGSIGRTDLPLGDFATLMDSIGREILALPDETLLIPGHGSSTTVGAERRGNPFLVPQFGGPERGYA